jgi:hypothetical protein
MFTVFDFKDGDLCTVADGIVNSAILGTGTCKFVYGGSYALLFSHRRVETYDAERR